MASVTPFNHFHSICRARFQHQHHRCLVPSRLLHLSFSLREKNGIATHCCPPLTITHKVKPARLKWRFAAEDTQIPEQAGEAAAVEEAAPTAVLFSPSDKLFMHFQAEGTINETAIPRVTKALQDVEGVADLRVQVFEGIASVELTKETTTGVASGLVEIIQGSGFKLQTLNLSFEDEEQLVA